MSFTDQKSFIVTEKQVLTKWGGAGLRCSLCGHNFNSGDIARWVYCNSTPEVSCGNFFTCVNCDGTDVMQRGNESYNSAVQSAKAWGIYGPDWQI